MSIMHTSSTVMAKSPDTGGPPPPLSVVATNDTQDHVTGSSPAVAGIRIDGDNNIYASNASGTYSAHDTPYVFNGDVDEVWVERTIDSGSLTRDDIGASRRSCVSDWTIENRDTDAFGSPEEGTVTVSFYDAASGGSLLDTATYILNADYDLA